MESKYYQYKSQVQRNNEVLRLLELSDAKYKKSLMKNQWTLMPTI
jgi:hypothetical protein